MLPSLRKLLRVQELDTRIAVVDADLAGLPGELDEIERGIADAIQAIADAKQSIERTELEERRLESDMAEQEALMKRLDEQTMEVKTQHAYEALQHEIERAREAGSRYETQALELMEAIDQARTELAEAEQSRSEREAAKPDQQTDIAARKQMLGDERTELLSARGSACEGVQRDVMAKYDRVKDRFAPVVLIMKTKACPRCHIAVPTEHAMKILRGDAIEGCSSCHRLLVTELALSDTEAEANA